MTSLNINYEGNFIIFLYLKNLFEFDLFYNIFMSLFLNIFIIIFFNLSRTYILSVQHQNNKEKLFFVFSYMICSKKNIFFFTKLKFKLYC